MNKDYRLRNFLRYENEIEQLEKHKKTGRIGLTTQKPKCTYAHSKEIDKDLNIIERAKIYGESSPKLKRDNPKPTRTDSEIDAEVKKINSFWESNNVTELARILDGRRPEYWKMADRLRAINSYFNSDHATRDRKRAELKPALDHLKKTYDEFSKKKIISEAAEKGKGELSSEYIQSTLKRLSDYISNASSVTYIENKPRRIPSPEEKSQMKEDYYQKNEEWKKSFNRKAPQENEKEGLFTRMFNKFMSFVEGEKSITDYQYKHDRKTAKIINNFRQNQKTEDKPFEYIAKPITSIVEEKETTPESTVYFPEQNDNIVSFERAKKERSRESERKKGWFSKAAAGIVLTLASFTPLYSNNYSNANANQNPLHTNNNTEAQVNEDSFRYNSTLENKIYDAAHNTQLDFTDPFMIDIPKIRPTLDYHFLDRSFTDW